MSCVVFSKSSRPSGLTFPICEMEKRTPSPRRAGGGANGRIQRSQVALLPPTGACRLAATGRPRAGWGTRPGRARRDAAEGRGSGRGLAAAPPAAAPETMAPAAGRWAPALWRACNGLMAAFFALAALVQVSGPAPGGGWRPASGGRGAPQGAGLQGPSGGPACSVYTDKPAGSQGRRSGQFRWRTRIASEIPTLSPHLRHRCVYMTSPHSSHLLKSCKELVQWVTLKGTSAEKQPRHLNIQPVDENEHNSGPRT